MDPVTAAVASCLTGTVASLTSRQTFQTIGLASLELSYVASDTGERFAYLTRHSTPMKPQVEASAPVETIGIDPNQATYAPTLAQELRGGEGCTNYD